MHYERLGRAKRFTGAAVGRRVVATKQPLGLENYQSVSSPGGSSLGSPVQQLGRTGWNAIRGVLLAPSDQPHSGTTRTTTAAGWGQTGGRRRLWPPRRDANVRGSGTSELRAKRAVFMVRSVLIVLACRQEDFGPVLVSPSARVQQGDSRDSWIIHHKEVIASHDLQRSGMVRA